MKQSMRARRMERHHKRSKNQSKLNLVSLMDIFTILVFFLLVNSSDVEILQTNKSIELPQSISEQRPDTTLVVTVSQENIVVAGRAVATIAEITSSEANDIPGLTKELKYQAERAGPLPEDKQQQGRPITIMGDKEVPYTVLKKIMTTCATNEYRNISLAVSKVGKEPVDANAASTEDLAAINVGE
ncbi:ExbD/TolR family protein [Aurantivibrio plasticivorans]